MAEAREMVAASEKAGKLYMVSQSRRYDASLHALRQLVVDQTGPLGILNTDFYIGAHFGGFRDEMASVLLLDMAIHTFDAARYVSGADPVSVYCEEFNPEWSWYSGASSATALFEMTGGLRYTYRGSWSSEGRDTSWEADWRCVGPRGTAVWDGSGTNPPSAGVVRGAEGFTREADTVEGTVRHDKPTGIAGSLQDFLNALQTGGSPMGECHDNIKSLAMVFAAIESSATGSACGGAGVSERGRRANTAGGRTRQEGEHGRRANTAGGRTRQEGEHGRRANTAGGRTQGSPLRDQDSERRVRT